MATTATFSGLLREYMPYEMLYEELEKRNYLIGKIQKDQSWGGGQLDVPFIGNMGSSFSYGGLTTNVAGTNAIHEFGYVKGTLSNYKELWGSILFHQRDLDQDNLKGSLLKILPDQLEMFLSFMGEVTSMALLNGPHFATVTDSTNGATGVFIVDHPERFQLGQQVWMLDDDTAVSDGASYVYSIDMNTKTIVIHTTRAGGVADDLSAYTTAQNCKFYLKGATSSTNTFNSLRGMLLSNANGGDATILGQTKTGYPFLQAINVDGSSIDATNITSKLFDALTSVRQIGKGMCDTAIMSYKHLGSIMKDLEVSRDYTAADTKASAYGWTEIKIVGVKGQVTIVGIPECDDDVIYLVDFKTMKFHTNGWFQRRKAPDGKEWFEERAESGYTYIVDTRLYGDFTVSRPNGNGIIHTISY